MKLKAPAQKVTASSSRGIFNQLKLEYPGKQVSPGYLRVEQTLINSTGKYKFNIKSIGGEVATEAKLDRNDLFVATGIGVFLLREVTAEIGGQALQSYPNQTIFPAAAGFNPVDMEAIYNGFFSLKIATTVNIEKLSMLNFRRAPQTQQSAATNYSQFNLDEAIYNPGSLIYLHGTADTEVVVEYNSFAGIEIASVVAGTLNKLVFMPVGYLIKGAAKNQN